MRKGSLGVTFFPVCMSVCPSANFGKFNSECQEWLGMGQTTPDPPVSVQWTGSGPEADWKWAGSGHVRPSVCLSVHPLPH